MPRSLAIAPVKKQNDDPAPKTNQFKLNWLSPAKNPYMLFVYPILFIVAVDFFHLGPAPH